MVAQVAKNTVVTLDYNVTDPDGELVDAGKEPLIYLHGGYDDIFPMIEEALQGKKVGESIVVKMQPDDAFGDYEAELVRVEPLDVFPDDVELTVGMVFEADDPETGDVLMFRVTQIADGKVVVDANHPLAGQSVRFVATVADVRPASPDEISHGHAHGEHGHHH